MVRPCQYRVVAGEIGACQNDGSTPPTDLAPTQTHTAAERTLVYVCGPAAMIDDAERIYTKEGGPGGRPALRREQVLFERWW